MLSHTQVFCDWSTRTTPLTICPSPAGSDREGEGEGEGESEGEGDNAGEGEGDSEGVVDLESEGDVLDGVAFVCGELSEPLLFPSLRVCKDTHTRSPSSFLLSERDES